MKTIFFFICILFLSACHTTSQKFDAPPPFGGEITFEGTMGHYLNTQHQVHFFVTITHLENKKLPTLFDFQSNHR